MPNTVLKEIEKNRRYISEDKQRVVSRCEYNHCIWRYWENDVQIDANVNRLELAADNDLELEDMP